MRTPKDLEKRMLVNDVEVNGRILEGYAIVYDSVSRPFEWGHEIIAPGAVTEEILRKSDIYFVTDHNPMNRMGRSRFMTSGTLMLSIDEKGLKFSIELPNTQLANDTLELIKAQVFQGVSFAFTVEEEEITVIDDGNILRTITKFKRLYDVSIVTDGAYEAAYAQIRSVEAFKLRSYYQSIEEKYGERAKAPIEAAQIEARQLNDTEVSELEQERIEREALIAQIVNDTLFL